MNSDLLLTKRRHSQLPRQGYLDPAAIPVWPVVLIVSSIVAMVAAGGWIDGVPRSAIVMWFLFVCPGLAMVEFLAIEDRINRFALAVPLSLAIATLGSIAGIYGSAWSPTSLLFALALFTIVGAGLRLALEYRSIDSTGEVEVDVGRQWQTEPATLAPITSQPYGVLVKENPIAMPQQSNLLGKATAPSWSFAVLAVEDLDRGNADQSHLRGAENRFMAADVVISNDSDAPLAFNLTDIRLRGTDGSEYPGGEIAGSMPRLTGQNLPPGDLARGWIWFNVPAEIVVAEIRFYGPSPILHVPLPRKSVS
jgi:hypothetical protein